MYNSKDIQFLWKHDFDKESAAEFSKMGKTFSINIFQWIPSSNEKHMRRGKCVIRLTAESVLFKEAIIKAEEIVLSLDKGEVFEKNLSIKTLKTKA